MNILKKYKFLVFLLLIFSIFACKHKKIEKEKIFSDKNYKKTLINVNKYLLKTEDEQIEDYIKRYKWDMKKTGTGLRYLIYKHGKGQKAKKNEIAKINYTIKLLNGDLCYSSEQQGPKEFIIGKGEMISGVEEGILLLRVGDKANFIIPSYLAYGVIGDQNKIPGNATLIYDIKLLNLKEK